jgi:hypothetical protein
MMTDRRLPIVAEDEAPAACGTVQAGLSDDEVVLTTRLRELSTRARELRRELETAGDDVRPRLAEELDTLRREREDVAAARERAYRDKMRALGHLAE